MRYWRVVGVLVFFIVCGVSCGKSNTASSGAFKVALLSPGPVSDAGWNASAYEGLRRIKTELGAEISQVETKTPAEFEQGFRDYASKGYQLVFGHGFEFQDAAAAVSKDFPNTVFITTSGTTVRPNVAPVVFEIEQATYLLGMMAAKMSKTGKAGAVGGVQIPSVKSSFDAFDAGARAVNPNFKVVVSYIGNWEDVGAAKEATLALIDQGVDFVFHNADAAGLGVFQAVQERKGVYAFGSNKDQNSIAPDVILASAALSVPNAFVTVARQVKENTFKAEPMRLGMKEDAVSLILNPKLEGKIPPDVRALVEEGKQKILAGTLKVKGILENEQLRDKVKKGGTDGTIWVFLHIVVAFLVAYAAQVYKGRTGAAWFFLSLFVSLIVWTVPRLVSLTDPDLVANPLSIHAVGIFSVIVTIIVMGLVVLSLPKRSE